MYKFSKFLLIVLLLLFSAQTIFAGRYYDSATGRWLSVDPKASKYPGWTSYNYALNNPLKYVDPDGKNPELAAAAAIVIGTGIVITATYLATKNYLAHPSAVNFPNQTNITTTGIALGFSLFNAASNFLSSTNKGGSNTSEDIKNKSSTSDEQHQSFKKQVKQYKEKGLNSAKNNIKEHQQKIRNNPDSKSVKHWEHEVKTWKEQLKIIENEIINRGIK